MSDEDRLAELLLDWEERYGRGEDVAAADLCPDRPDLVPRLAGCIELLRRVAWVARPPGNADGGKHPPSDEPLSPGPLAGRYRLDVRIGEGGFGQVWRGFDLELQRPVAVKLPRSDHHSGGSDDAFLAEARKVAGLACPGVVPVYDVGREGGKTFIVSELIDGIDLARRVRTGPLPVREAVRVVAEVAQSLHHAHQRGFVHRDIKPANLLLDRHRRVFVTDFGIAVTQDELAGRGEDGSGTLAYMSPERLFGDPTRIDVRTDVYSLGIVLYELLTGRRPFEESTSEKMREAILKREPQPARSLVRDVGRELDRICSKCLAKSPANRHPTAEALADDLTRWLTRQRSYWIVSGLGVLVVCGGLAAIMNAGGTGPNPPLPDSEPNPIVATAPTHAPQTRPAAPTLDKAEALFDGRSRDGWSFFSGQPEPPGAVQLKDGTLLLRSVLPQHYRLCSERTFRDFVLSFEYRYPPDRTFRGYGCTLIVRVTNPSNSVGDNTKIKFGDWTVGHVVPPEQSLGKTVDLAGLPAAKGVERPFGEWNEMTVSCTGRVVEVWVNGRHVNRVNGLPDNDGRVGFSCHEYKELWLRNIRVRPLER